MAACAEAGAIEVRGADGSLKWSAVHGPTADFLIPVAGADAFITGSWSDRTIRTWTWARDTPLATVVVPAGWRNISNTPAGGRFATTSGALVTIWDACTGSELRTVDLGAPAGDLAFSPDGSRLAVGVRNTATQPTKLVVLDPQTGGEVLSAARLPDPGVVNYARSGVSIFGGGQQAGCWVFDTNTKAWHTNLEPGFGSVTARAVSPDGAKVCLGTSHGGEEVKEASTGTTLWRHSRAHSTQVTTCEFSPDGEVVLTACARDRTSTARPDNRVLLWRAATGERLGTLVRHSASVNAACFTPDGAHVLSAGGDGAVCVGEPSGGQSRDARLVVDADAAFAPRCFQDDVKRLSRAVAPRLERPGGHRLSWQRELRRRRCPRAVEN